MATKQEDTHATSKQVNCHSLRMKASFEWIHGHLVLGWLGRLFVISRWGGWCRTGCVNRHNNTCTWWNRFSSKIYPPRHCSLPCPLSSHSQPLSTHSMLHAIHHAPRASYMNLIPRRLASIPSLASHCTLITEAHAHTHAHLFYPALSKHFKFWSITWTTLQFCTNTKQDLI